MQSPMRASPAQPPVTLCQRQPRGLWHPPSKKKERIQEFMGQRSKISDLSETRRVLGGKNNFTFFNF